jgi:hypothetical protein
MSMRPEIDGYLRANGAKYTTEALRGQLIAAGHDPAEVDAAIAQFDAERSPALAQMKSTRSRFWWTVLAVNAAGLVIATIWAFQGASSTYAGAVPVVLGVAMLIGMGIFGLIGRALLGRGLAVALLLPVIVAILLTGTCMAMFGPPSVT